MNQLSNYIVERIKVDNIKNNTYEHVFEFLVNPGTIIKYCKMFHLDKAIVKYALDKVAGIVKNLFKDHPEAWISWVEDTLEWMAKNNNHNFMKDVAKKYPNSENEICIIDWGAFFKQVLKDIKKKSGAK